MKKIFTTASIFFLFTLSAFAQQISWDELQEGIKKPSGAFTSYISKDGVVYNSGNKLKIGRPSTGKFFTFITQGGLLNDEPNVNANMSNTDTEIINFRVGGNKRMGLKIWMKAKGFVGIVNYIVDFENAIESGEIIAYGMTSDQALSELKKAKDKLELELITKEQYEEIKKDLSRYIK